MGNVNGPTLRARWLGDYLRELREAAKLTLRDAGAYLQRDASTVSRFETALYPPRMPDVLALLDLYGVSDERKRDGLVKLSRDVWQRGWFDSYADDAGQVVIDYAFCEERATQIRSFDPNVVPGSLQTPEYANAVIRAADPTASDTQVERWLELRMKRQEVLSRPDPLRLSVVLDEAVLRRCVGGRSVMRSQLDHLVGVAARPSITLRVLPFAVGAHASPEGQFGIFEMSEPYPDVAYMDTRAGGIYVEADEVGDYTLAFDRLVKDALGPRRSVECIRSAAEEFQ